MWTLLAVSLALFATSVANYAQFGDWCRFGNAFVGTGRQHRRDFVDTGNQVELAPQMTIEAWIWSADPLVPTWDSIVSRAPLFWKYETGVPNVYADFNFQVDDDGLLSFFMGNGLVEPFQYGVLLLSPEPVPAQKWIHVAVVVEASGLTPSRVRMYIDGELVDQDLWGYGERQFGTKETNQLRVSRYDNTDSFNLDSDAKAQYWHGYIDELRIWNTARTPTQLRAFMFLSLNDLATDDLALYYKFNVQPRDESQTLIKDYSGNGYDGVLQHDGPLAPPMFSKALICV